MNVDDEEEFMILGMVVATSQQFLYESSLYIIWHVGQLMFSKMKPQNCLSQLGLYRITYVQLNLKYFFINCSIKK